ncbi:MAG TPA: M17 family peptidase N-terminal domain-containing protein, partial [candidate division Zixibacteria bacterium]
MQTQVKSGRIDHVGEDAIILGCFEPESKSTITLQIPDDRLSSFIAPLLVSGDFTAKLGQAVVLYPQNGFFAKRIILTGLGKKNEVTTERIRKAYAYAGKKARELKIRSLAVMALESDHLPIKLRQSSQAIVEGILLANYKLDRYITEAIDQKNVLQNLIILASKPKRIPEIEKG